MTTRSSTKTTDPARPAPAPGLLLLSLLAALAPASPLLAQINPKEPPLPGEPFIPDQPVEPDLPLEGESGRAIDPDLLDSGRRIGDLVPVAHERIAWSARADANLASGPVVCGRGVLVGTVTGHVQLLDAGRGTEVWRTRVGPPITVRPGVLDDRVLALDAISGMNVLELGAGGVLRTVPMPDGDVVDRIAPFEELVAVATRAGIVVLLERESLRVVSRTRVPGSPATAPIVVGDHAIVALAATGLHAVRTRDGRAAWTRPIAGGVNGAPVHVRTPDGLDRIVVAGAAAGVVAVDAATGREVWRHREAGAPIGLAAPEGRLLAVFASRRLVELEPSRGGALRGVALGGVPSFAPTVGARGVLVARANGVLELFDDELRRGDRIELRGALAGPPAVSGSTAYVGLKRRLVYRVRLD